MFLKNIELLNFRNYKSVRIDFKTQKTILTGKNAQGKTNLLESILYLSQLSTPRSNHDSELVFWNENFARIKGFVKKSYTESTLEVFINPPKSKILKVNGIKKKKFSEFLGNLIAVSFSVDDLLLLRGSPSDRRGWIDSSIIKLYPMYSERLSKYNKIRNQRNNLLKSFAGNINITDTLRNSLSVWDEQLIVAGSNLIHLRLKFLKEIQNIARNKHKIISKDKEFLKINYNSTIFGFFDFDNDEIFTSEQIADFYKKSLKEKINEEIIRSQTLIGPHRDDIAIYINDADAIKYASQGQQRTVVLSLKLSELDFIRKITGEIPLLLLDDVLAELDDIRQNYLLDSIGKDIQTIITTTDISNFKKEFLTDVVVYNIESGIISDIKMEF